MHELGITEQLLTLTLRHANQAGAARVTHLHLIIGEFSSVLDNSLQFYWDQMAGGTIAEGAQLHFKRIPGVLRCLDCKREFGLSEFDRQCPGCGGQRTGVVSGDEFRLESIEIEDGNEQKDRS